MVSSHVAFGDESNCPSGRYRSIGLVTLCRKEAIHLHHKLHAITADSQIIDLKWAKMRNAKYRLAALKVMKTALALAAEKKLRIDVLCWDIQDYRHSIAGRDDIANLQRMYYHLFRNVMTFRWPPTCTWKLIPDQQSMMNWRDVQNFLTLKSSSPSDKLEFETDDIEENKLLATTLRQHFHILDIEEGNSEEMFISQVADLFAGVANFSRLKFNSYTLWQQCKNYDSELFSKLPDPKFSKSEAQKFAVLESLVNQLESSGLRVSFESTRGLRTFDPSVLMNFWWYESRSELDHAPTKNKKGSKFFV